MSRAAEARRTLAEAEQTLDDVRERARSGKATAQALADAAHAVDVARLRVEGAQAEDRQAEVDSDHRTAVEVASRWDAVLCDLTEQHLSAIEDGEDAAARIILSGEALNAALAEVDLDLRAIKHLPAGVARHLDRNGLLTGIEVAGKVWPVNRERTAQALIEPLAKARHLLDRGGAAWRRLTVLWHLSGERETRTGVRYPSDGLRDAMERAA
jgi:hypothetical protein